MAGRRMEARRERQNLNAKTPVSPPRVRALEQPYRPVGVVRTVTPKPRASAEDANARTSKLASAFPGDPKHAPVREDVPSSVRYP